MKTCKCHWYRFPFAEAIYGFLCLCSVSNFSFSFIVLLRVLSSFFTFLFLVVVVVLRFHCSQNHHEAWLKHVLPAFPHLSPYPHVWFHWTGIEPENLHFWTSFHGMLILLVWKAYLENCWAIELQIRQQTWTGLMSAKFFTGNVTNIKAVSVHPSTSFLKKKLKLSGCLVFHFLSLYL